MDGETALKYVRSRHAQGDEGTDTARSARQQKLLSAMKTKLLSKDVLLNPARALDIANAVRNSIETDITDSNLMVLARLAFLAKDNLVAHVLPEDLLVNPAISARYDSQYVFVPASGTWDQIHKWVVTTFNN
jgi:anionic cell wall polymer biosynthesis LytR-Cps2A-Psr (LCP) family protein